MADDPTPLGSKTQQVFSEVNCGYEERELEVDIVEWLRQYGARFIRDLNGYHHCTCFVPPLIRAHFDKCQRTFPRSASLRSYNGPPSREDFNVDVYGDFCMQDFFLERDERESAFGLIHFSKKFMNIEYDCVLREYNILYHSGEPGISLTCRGSKNAFKGELKNFIRNHSSPEPSCPPVCIDAHMFVLTSPIRRSRPRSESFTRKRKSFLQDIVDKRRKRKPVEFPCTLQYYRNWLVPTIAEQSAAYLDFAETPTKLTDLEDIAALKESEIFLEDPDGHTIIPQIVLRKKRHQSGSSIPRPGLPKLKLTALSLY